MLGIVSYAFTVFSKLWSDSVVFKREKTAINRFFKLFVISPVQWIAWTQNYFFLNQVTKRDVLAKEKKINFFTSVLGFPIFSENGS